MKKILYIILVFALAMLTTCKKKPELKVYKLELGEVEIEVTSSSATVSADYSYPTELEGVKLLVGTESALGDATETDAEIADNKITATVRGLQSLTKYYYCFRYSTGVNLENTETGSFTTQSSGGTTDELAVTTLTVASITTTTAVSGGHVTGDGGYEVTMRGVCWNTSGEPTVADSRTLDGTGTGVFLSSISGLEPSTEYHVRAYAINEMDTVYGEQLDFTTQSNIYGTVVTGEVTNITMTSARTSGNVIDDGGVAVFERGICWDTIANPTIETNKITSGSGVGSFICTITGLTLNSTYHVRAYATNTNGTNYGDDVEFTTLGTVPVVTTVSVSDVTFKSAKVAGNVSNEWGSEVTERGICYSTTENPTTANNKVTAGAGLGDFECDLVNLMYNTNYYVRAYAINGYGTNYGEQLDFRTNNAIVVTTNDVTGITGGSAVFHGDAYIEEGATGAQIGYRGFCWGTSHYPTYENSNHVMVSGTGAGTFSTTVNDLAAGTTYYVRAWANSAGGGGKLYGNEVSFTAGVAQIPSVTINPATNVTYNSAYVQANASGYVVERGFCYGTTHNPGIMGDHVAQGSGSGSFSASLANMSDNTTYYVRAYASNEAGVAYSDEISFTTEVIPAGDTFLYSFDDHNLSGWTNIDADGDGYRWRLGSNLNLPAQGSHGHNSSADFVLSQSYDNDNGPLQPNNYLVSPQVTIGPTATLSFWACAQDAAYPSEHFGVAISTTGNTSASSFTMVQEWTLTAKDEGKTCDSNRSGRAQGNWHQFTVMLSAYAGQQVYIAIRHFNSTDMFFIDVDDIELTY